MGPEVDGLPGAGDGRELARRVAEFVAPLTPPVRAMLRLAVRALEWSPFPRRMSRIDRERRERVLAGMETSRLALRRDLLLLAKLLYNLARSDEPEVREAVGAEMSCAVAPDAERPQPMPPRVLPSLRTESIECDVAVVGSGAGGAAAACVLAEAGYDVAVIEAGGDPRHDHREGEVMPSLGRFYRDGGLTIAAGRPAIPIPVGRVLGGTTVVNSGTCFRAPDEVLEDWRERSGIEWATDLAGTYEGAERMLHVRRLEPDEMGMNGNLAMRGAEALGVSGRPLDRNAGRCVQCSGCPLGCPIDAKRSMRVTYLPRAKAAGARLVTGTEAIRLVVEKGRCVGIEAEMKGRDREHLPDFPLPYSIRAKQVVLAGGALGTPELLQRSGLGGPMVGRGLHVHPATWVGARYAEPVRGWQGVMQSYYIDEWKSRGLFLEATFTPLAFGGAWLPGVGAEFQRGIRDFDHVGSIGVHLTDRASNGRVLLGNDGPGLSYRLAREEAARIAFGIARAAEIHFAAGAVEVYPNIAGLPRLLPGQLDRIDPSRIRGRDLRLEAFHPMSTARIDPDPRRGVCAPDGSVHGVEGLYVADASLFPGAVGVNPMMTVIAMATRIAEMIVERD